MKKRYPWKAGVQVRGPVAARVVRHGCFEALKVMVTHMFICNKCDGDLESRIFEVEYCDYRTAEISPMPKCPVCGVSKHVTRFFGHNIFGSIKKKAEVPEQYVPLNPSHHKSILSIGMRMNGVDEKDEEKKIESDVRDFVQKLVDVSSMEVIENNDPESDVLEKKLNLRKGTLDRTLFDIRQKHMLEELKNGKKVSGFFMPLAGGGDN